ncbi:MAG TPA: hypothetical protein VL381_10550 [Rhodocyclaceae bacterium]|jgi:hypothetical protein|nr:hypothetical protein [Rhodocyclaceae bacterium]
MYRLLQLAALFGIVLIATLELSNMPQFSQNSSMIQYIGFSLNLILAGEALRTLWRN